MHLYSMHGWLESTCQLKHSTEDVVYLLSYSVISSDLCFMSCGVIGLYLWAFMEESVEDTRLMLNRLQDFSSRVNYIQRSIETTELSRQCVYTYT